MPEEMLTLRNPGYETSVVNNNVFTGSFLASSEYNGGCVQEPDCCQHLSQFKWNFK